MFARGAKSSCAKSLWKIGSRSPVTKLETKKERKRKIGTWHGPCQEESGGEKKIQGSDTAARVSPY